MNSLPRSSQRTGRSERPPTPAVPPPGSLTSSVTFFVSAAERSAILSRLRAIHRDRATALLIALQIDRTGDTP